MTRELLKQALDALEDAVGLHVRWDEDHTETIEALRAALAQQEPLHTFLNAAAGEGLVLDGVDAADLYIAVFPDRYAATVASITGEPAHPPAAQPAPIDMVLHCPACGKQHIDAPDERTPDWKNEPHRSHLCHGCGHIWRPADVPTNGVAAVRTKGKADSPLAQPAPAPAGWMPIESAPKGLVLLLSQSGTHYIDRGEYAHRMIAAAKQDGDECFFTHWMPLPPAPGAAPAPAVPTDAALNTLAKMFHHGEEIEGDDGAAMMVDMALWNEGLEAFESLIGEGDGETLASSAAPPAQAVPLTPLTHMQIVMLWGHRNDGPSTPEIVSFARAVIAEFCRVNGITAPEANNE